MGLTAGARLGPYEITAQIGAGGMGEVYKARDTKLDRSVAIKILPGSFAHIPDRLARFEREAKALAALNHPNIAIVHGFEEADGVQALVMELVDGPTLADRIAQGRIALDEGLLIARQIVEALEASHQQGIVHRDLKPANIKLRPDGIVKVLDFGLAKVLETPAATNATVSPTITSPAATQMGVILGTAAYMSPEQARGLVADKRSDLWAFGCVLYEILTSRRAFEGDDVSDTLASVLKSQPDWKAFPPETPAPVRRLLRRCLTKDLKGRIADASTARIEIDEAVHGGPDIDGEIVRKPPRRRERLLWVSALAITTMIAAIAFAQAVRPVPTPPERRLEITSPPTTDPWSLSMSPDGEKVVFVATSEGRPRLWLRSLDSVSARPLAGTDRAFLPFWSPDSRSVGFFAEGQLKRVDITGGTIQTLASLARPEGLGFGGTWNRDDVIVFSPGPGSSIFRVSAAGGNPVAVTRVERPQQQHHYSPMFLPDGRHFLYYVLGGSREASGVYIGQLDGSPPQRVLDADAPAVYASSGHLLLVRRETLFAQRFDPVRFRLIGDPFPVAEQVRAGYGPLFAPLSASAAGSFVYRSGSAAGRPELVWFDRFGKELEKVSGTETGFFFPSLSPDGRRVAVSRVVDGNVDVWLLDAGGGVVRLSRLTTDAADDVYPIWSQDGARIVFTSKRRGTFDLYQRPATGGGSDVLLRASTLLQWPTDSSSDGRLLIFNSQDPTTRNDIWALPLDGDRKPFSVVQTESDQEEAQLSPDGKWIAYQSNESGRFEIYVQPFSGAGRKSLVSTAGGYQPHWRGDGKELFYIAGDNQLVAVPIRVASDGQSIEPGAPLPLFRIRTTGPIEADRWYAVAPDGQRFLVNNAIEEATAPISVVLNWKPQR